MNFDELKKQWDQQTGDAIDIKTESIRKTKSIVEKINKNFKRDLMTSILVLLFLLLLPIINNYNAITLIYYYFILIQIALVSSFHFKNLFTFKRITKDEKVLNTKEQLVRVYYSLKFAIESYKSSLYMIYPSLLLFTLIFALERDGKSFNKYIEDLSSLFQQKPVVLIILLIFVHAIVIGILIFSNYMLNKQYTKPLQEIRHILDDFDE